MNNTKELPRYKCHKEVWALKIKEVHYGTDCDGAPNALLVPEDETYGNLEVSGEFVLKHNPQPGGYYVQYKDGYQSFSPAEAFEGGYALIA